MILTILTISSILTGTLFYSYRKELNKSKDIEAKFKAAIAFADNSGTIILKLRKEKKELQNFINTLKNDLILSQARNKVNTITKTAEKALIDLVAVEGIDKSKSKRDRRKKPSVTKK